MMTKLRSVVPVGFLLACCFLCVASSPIDDTSLSGPGLNVCVRKRSDVRHVVTWKSFTKPVYKPFLRRCNSLSSRLCSSYSTIYQRSYKKVKISKLETVTLYSCCPGWTKEKGSANCNIAICANQCKNNGTCTKPNTCTCRSGWTGSDCSEDIDECAVQNGGCSQICINVLGSYHCACKDGYDLKGKSCEVCLHCSKEWKKMENKMLTMEKEIRNMRKTLMAHEGVEMLSLTDKKEDSQGPPGTKGEKGDTGPRGPPGPPADVLGSIIGRLAHFEELIEQCQCRKKVEENEVLKHETEQAVASQLHHVEP